MSSEESRSNKGEDSEFEGQHDEKGEEISLQEDQDQEEQEEVL